MRSCIAVLPMLARSLQQPDDGFATVCRLLGGSAKPKTARRILNENEAPEGASSRARAVPVAAGAMR
jgi:hypothetical protein